MPACPKACCSKACLMACFCPKKKPMRRTVDPSGEMSAIQAREILMRHILRDTIFYFIFMVLSSVLGAALLDYESYFLNRALQEAFLNGPFYKNGSAFTFSDIHDNSEFWIYLETALFEGPKWNDWYTDISNTTVYESKLLGVPRLRQLKVHSKSCELQPDMKAALNITECYAEYSKKAEDKTTFADWGAKPPDGVDVNLVNTAFSYSSPEDTGNDNIRGQLATYSGGGYYIDLTLNKAINKKIIHSLKTLLWIRPGTRCVFLQFTVYNPNINLFCGARIIFEFPATGGVLTSASFSIAKFIRYSTTFDYFIMACEMLFFCFVFYYTYEVAKKVNELKKQYLTDPWSYVEMLLLMYAFAFVTTSMLIKIKSKRVIAENIYLTDTYANFESALGLAERTNFLYACFLVVAYIKIFKYLNVNRTMMQLNRTLKKCLYNVLGFLVMFVIIFTAYAEIGRVLFGTKVAGFSGFGVAMFTLFRTILGDFNYSEIEDANRILAPIFFISYIILVFFVLLNMFLAIINDTYSDVKTELTYAPEEMQMAQFLNRGFRKMLRKFGCGGWAPVAKIAPDTYHISCQNLREDLKRCGFTDIEIEMFMSRYNIDQTTELGEFDLNKLMADLEGKSFERTPTPGTEQQTSKRGNVLVTTDDLLIQQERLAIIENTIGDLTTKVDGLLKKLDTLDDVRKGPGKK